MGFLHAHLKGLVFQFSSLFPTWIGDPWSYVWGLRSKQHQQQQNLAKSIFKTELCEYTDSYILNPCLCVCSFVSCGKVIQLHILGFFFQMYCRTVGWQHQQVAVLILQCCVLSSWRKSLCGRVHLEFCLQQSANPVCWSKAVHPKDWPSWNLPSNCVVLCLMQILSGVILEVLGEAFTELITAEVASAWTKLLANMCCGIAAVYKETGWPELPSSVEWGALVYRIKGRYNREMGFP